jgi:hypothetical protein
MKAKPTARKTKMEKCKNKLFEQSEMKHNNQKGFFLAKPSA